MSFARVSGQWRAMARRMAAQAGMRLSAAVCATGALVILGGAICPGTPALNAGVRKPAAALPQGQSPSSPSAHDHAQTTRITPAQAKELFRSVDAILRFDSRITGLPILHPVKRRLVTRDQVVQYLDKQLENGRDAKRLERSELVLKKFGLIDRNFALRPFLVKLLREQIAGYYDDKTGTVNLLDWVPPGEQKPVLAHELTHALQDQHVDLEKWGGKSDLSISKNVKQDNRHIATDEEDLARDAVVEGQAMVAFVDYALAPTGKTLLDVPPEMTERLNEAMSNAAQAPVLAKAPLVLQRSLLFPYADGLSFVRAVLAARGKQAAFAGLLDDPPSSSYEIMTPEVYLHRLPIPRLRMPDIHPLIRKLYRPYDVGVIGEFDVQVIAEQYGGKALSKALTPAWRGGIYFAAQSRSAETAAERNSPDSLALLYLSRWASSKAAQSFADMYAREILREYPRATRMTGDGDAAAGGSSRGWTTSAGPVLIAVSGKTVFVSESFPLKLARKLEPIMIGSVTGSSASQVARTAAPGLEPGPELETDLTAPLRAWAFLAAPPLRLAP